VNKTDALTENERLQIFLDDLTRLGREYGFGITGEPTLFVMEYPVDHRLEYAMRADGRLFFA
jgi:hypothetical protein